jgi:hypothetical protein
MVDAHPTSTTPTAATAATAPTAPTVELPALGYPVSEKAVNAWFRDRHGHAPTDQELGAIMGAMAEREAQSPRTGPSPLPEGWNTGPSAPPATRR